MTAEQKQKIAWLNRVYYSYEKSTALIAQRNRLEELIQCVAVNYGGKDMGKSSGSQNGTESPPDKLEKVKQDIDNELKRLEDTYIEINNAINHINDNEIQAILRRRYLSFETWEKIAEHMGCDERTIRRKHKKIIEKLPAFALVCPP